MKKYEATVTTIGPMVKELLQQGILILFDNTAPLELQEISVLHTGGILVKDLENEDEVVLGNTIYTITAIGEVANKNLKNIGHVCLKFDARTSPELPGDINLEGDTLPLLKTGDVILIKRETL